MNGRALVVERESICTIAEMIDGEVVEELIFWKVNMENYFKDISANQAMKHDAYKRINRRMRQIKHGVHV
ncbi:MAG: hypothetical protein H0Z28_12725 [Archaeoglobus sp.]|nr:hypothetical protein [Archaeoglobus sp.]